MTETVDDAASPRQLTATEVLLAQPCFPEDVRRLRLEEWQITPTCRTNRGHDGAWEEAVRQLREVYDAQALRRRRNSTFVLALEAIDPNTDNGQPPAEDR